MRDCAHCEGSQSVRQSQSVSMTIQLIELHSFTHHHSLFRSSNNTPTNKQTNKPTNERTNKPTNQRTNEPTNEQMNKRTATNQPTKTNSNEHTNPHSHSHSLTHSLPPAHLHSLTHSLISLSFLADSSFLTHSLGTHARTGNALAD